MREIVTLQFGQQANYVGTHFWNTQESYFTYPPEEESPVDHDIHFRPGLAPDKSETFTPRTLIYDLKGAFGSMKKVNALYDPEQSEPTGSDVWASKPTVHRSAPIPPSPYQTHLDAGLQPPPLTTSMIRYWSDYSRLYYHPKSLVQLSEFEVNDQLMPFEKWEAGLELFEKLEREAELLDHDLRPFVEECDSLQGFQVLTGVDDAWGGWASGWMESLRDEYGKTSVWIWGLGEQGGNVELSRENRLRQMTNSALSLNIFGEQATVYIPMSTTPFRSPACLSMDIRSRWHTGALQAIGMETMTLPSRLRKSESGGGSLQTMEEIINSTGKRRIAKFELSVSDPNELSKARAAENAQFQHSHTSNTTRKDIFADDEVRLTRFDMDLFSRDYKIRTSKDHKKEHVFGRTEAARGEWEVAQGADRDPHDRFGDGPALQRYSTTLLFPVLDSFPSNLMVGSGNAKNLAVHSALTTSSSVAHQIRTLDQIVRRMIGPEDRESLSNGLQVLATEYDEGWESGSESNDDE